MLLKKDNIVSRGPGPETPKFANCLIEVLLAPVLWWVVVADDHDSVSSSPLDGWYEAAAQQSVLREG